MERARENLVVSDLLRERDALRAEVEALRLSERRFATAQAADEKRLADLVRERDEAQRQRDALADSIRLAISALPTFGPKAKAILEAALAKAGRQ